MSDDLASEALEYLWTDLGLPGSQIASAIGTKQAAVRMARIMSDVKFIPDGPRNVLSLFASMWRRLQDEGIQPGCDVVPGLSVEDLWYSARRWDLIDKIADGEPALEVIEAELPEWREMMVNRGTRVVDWPPDSAVPGARPERVVVVDCPTSRVIEALSTDPSGRRRSRSILRGKPT